MCGRTPRDATVQRATLQACFGKQTAEGKPLASTTWAVAATPATHGGLGLQSAMRTAPAAYWGAWADTLGYWHVRQPRLASACVQKHCRAAAPADRPFARPTPLPTFCEARAGRNAPLGQNSSAPHAQPRVPGRPGLATGLTAGSSTHRVHAHSTFAIACCCPPWSRLTRHCCCPSRAHKPPRGSRLYPRTGPPRCRRRSCKSLFADGSGCHSPWAPASAANMGTDAEGG